MWIQVGMDEQGMLSGLVAGEAAEAGGRHTYLLIFSSPWPHLLSCLVIRRLVPCQRGQPGIRRHGQDPSCESTRGRASGGAPPLLSRPFRSLACFFPSQIVPRARIAWTGHQGWLAAPYTAMMHESTPPQQHLAAPRRLCPPCCAVQVQWVRPSKLIEGNASKKGPTLFGDGVSVSQ